MKYSNGISGDSEAADAIRDIGESIDTDKLSCEQLDHIERVCAGIIVGCRDISLKRRGGNFKRRAWTQNRGSPVEEFCLPGCLDHESRWILDGKTTWVSEPYDLDKNDLRDLVRLLDEGWEVYVEGYSTHFPGSTLSVMIRRP